MNNKKTQDKTFVDEGFHAKGDIFINNYPKNVVSLFEESLKLSKLNMVSKKIYHFGEAVTGVYVFSESNASINASINEYPEHNYVSVDVYTCGEECDPMAVLEHFKSLIDVDEFNVKVVKY